MSRKLVNNALRLLEKEAGTVYKEPGGKVRVCLVYPNEYSIGMSNLGFQGVYAMLNQRPDVYCERAFLPSTEDMAEHERTGVELFSLESQSPLVSFDILALSVSFENDFPNVLRVLGLAGIPFRSAVRDTEQPLVVLGGVCAFSNPEPLAEFFDAVFVGEAEEMLPEFMDIFISSNGREELLDSAKEIEGVYVPAFYELEYAPGTHLADRLLGSWVYQLVFAVLLNRLHELVVHHHTDVEVLQHSGVLLGCDELLHIRMPGMQGCHVCPASFTALLDYIGGIVKSAHE